MSSELLQRSCVPCHGGVTPLKGAALAAWLRRVPGWDAVEQHHLYRRFTFPDFLGALAFVNRIGAVAEREQHHPDLALGWGRVEVTIYTHAINGLSENDFILAAKIDHALGGGSEVP